MYDREWYQGNIACKFKLISDRFNCIMQVKPDWACAVAFGRTYIRYNYLSRTVDIFELNLNINQKQFYEMQLAWL